ncbi:WD repeat-containing protein 44 isoform X1 [Morus notabilis]|uniref:WD repeat-containing protein 44 isoform X1 n=1 Tax=Morus notabilis TaxID=981085 RepID=UPI000CED232C|nr:WD repeat-containing protein 44 isoform X1 [Morus notabilis]
MSKTGDEEDEDECFYESLDRIVSSSCSCSTSNSDSEQEQEQEEEANAKNISNSNPNYDRHFPIPKFPMRVSHYDVWISEPSSVSERRRRLLREMGLSHDPSLSRAKPTDDGCGEFGRSASSDQLTRQRQAAGMVRSKSDGSDQCNCSCSCSCSSPSTCCTSSSAAAFVRSSCPILSIRTVSDEAGSFVNNNVNDKNNINNQNSCTSFSKSRSGESNGSPVADASSLNKPPLGKNFKRAVDEIRTGNPDPNLNPALSSSSLANSNRNFGNGGGEDEEVSEYNGSDERTDEPQVCTIRDLDNGKEFVVNEVREDGTWKKLKEVGTGRQLTMEEFQMCVGHSPIVQELMRRQNVEEGNKDCSDSNVNGVSGGCSKSKKKASWFKSIKSVANTMRGQKERRSSDERDTSSEKGGRRSSSATDDSQDASFHGPERVRIRQYGKSSKELTALYKSQEIQAHNGSIWSIKFSLDGRYLASAGEDCVIHVWQVVETERKGDLLMDKTDDSNLNMFFVANGSPEPTSLSPNVENNPEKKRRGRASISRKSLSLDHIYVPETVFALSEKPICSFQGHLDDVLDLSWSKSQHLLSSSMDKTVRLWHLSSQSCLKIFSHSDYVTCIQFNPVDDRYFISGSLDAKVRIWSIPDRQVVDWNDLHEMVTAACYTPDGQGALVGSYKGSCRLYNTSENKLQQKSQINLQNKKKKSHHKKITGFQLLISFSEQFAPGSSSEVLITSSDSRIRVVDGADLVHKFKGFRNTNTQISASLTTNGRYVVAASEDSHVYIWKHEADSRPSRSKGVTVTRSYEHFHCQDVSVAIPWPGMADTWGLQDEEQTPLDNSLDEVSTANHPPTPVEEAIADEGSRSASGCSNSPLHGTICSASNNYFFDRIAATWPEEKLLLATKNRSPRVSVDFSSNGVSQNMSAWGMVIVTAGLRGEIRTFQNFGLPIKI